MKYKKNEQKVKNNTSILYLCIYNKKNSTMFENRDKRKRNYQN